MRQKPSTRHVCDDAIHEKIDRLIDGELTRHEKSDLLNEIQKCKQCTEYMEKSLFFKGLVHNKLERKSCGTGMIDSIKQKLRLLPKGN